MIATAWSALARCALTQDSLASSVDDPIEAGGIVAIVFAGIFVVAAVAVVVTRAKQIRQ